MPILHLLCRFLSPPGSCLLSGGRRHLTPPLQLVLAPGMSPHEMLTGLQMLMAEMTSQPPGPRVHWTRGKHQLHPRSERGNRKMQDKRWDRYFPMRKQLLCDHILLELTVISSFKHRTETNYEQICRLIFNNAITDKLSCETLPFSLFIPSRNFQQGTTISPEVTKLCCWCLGVPSILLFLMGPRE